MFTVRWVTRGQEVSRIESESYPVNNPDMVAAACRLRLDSMQVKNPKALIDGFIILDGEEKVIRSWFPLKP
jgi:hypothetical protein